MADDERPKLTSPLLDVSLTDGSWHRIQTANVDLLAFEREQVKRKWPAPDAAPFHWLSFLAFSACKRLGIIDADAGLESFRNDELLDVGLADDETEALPTPPGVGPG